MSDENDAVFKLFTKRMMISEQQASPSRTTHMINQGEELIPSSLNFE